MITLNWAGNLYTIKHVFKPLFSAGLLTHLAPFSCTSDLADYCVDLQIIVSYLFTNYG